VTHIIADWPPEGPVGKCRTAPEEMFPASADAQRRVAATVCGPCPLRTECLAEALDARHEYGVWGGLTERERRALLKRRPDVASWRALLRAARAARAASLSAPQPITTSLEVTS
jgi:WhiB family redox-sensing transcriptional regulator